MSDSDDDRPISELISKRLAKRDQSKPSIKENNKRKNESIEDEDVDDKPITNLVRKKTKPANESKATNEKKEPSAKRNTSSTVVEYYSDTVKGMLVQKLLVRWWYAIEWPKKDDIGAPPIGYEPLEGFLGVFISTKSDSLGNILDLRNKDSCPSLRNISRWPCDKIKQKCIEAYENQMKILKEREGETDLYNVLKKELKEVKSTALHNAEKEAKKYQF